jgi:putative ABC transport system permease protein
LGDEDWQIIGITPIIISDGFATDPIYAPQAAVFAATKKHNEGSQVLVRTTSRDPAVISQVSTQLRTLYESRQMDLNVFISGTTPEDRINALNQFGIITSMLYGLAVIVALVGGIGLMGSLSISVVERTREIGVMRAIGARSGTIMGMLMMEGVLQGLLSWAIALPLSFILTKPVAQKLGETMVDITLDFKFSFSAVLIWLVIVLVISTLASILPARSATRISVRESLAYA